MRKSLILLFTALTLSIGLWAENPQSSPAGPIVYKDLHFESVDNERVKLVKNKDIEPVPYKGDIVVPDPFEFKDLEQKVYILTVIWIDDNAFADSPELTSVTLPATITKIGDNAFANSENLKSVTCLGTEPATLETEVFAGIQPTIYVPRGTKKTYQTAWSAYEDLICLSDLDQAKEDAIELIQTARQGILNGEINSIIDDAVNNIDKATKKEQIDDFRFRAMMTIGLVQIGKDEAKTELLGEMGEPCTDCTAVEVTDGTTTVILYNPTKVSYKKIEE